MLQLLTPRHAGALQREAAALISQCMATRECLPEQQRTRASKNKFKKKKTYKSLSCLPQIMHFYLEGNRIYV